MRIGMKSRKETIADRPVAENESTPAASALPDSSTALLCRVTRRSGMAGRLLRWRREGGPAPGAARTDFSESDPCLVDSGDLPSVLDRSFAFHDNVPPALIRKYCKMQLDVGVGPDRNRTRRAG